MMNQGGTNDLQRIEAHRSLLGREGGVDDIRGTWDICVGTKRKRQETSASHGFRTRARIGHLVRPGKCFVISAANLDI